MPIIRLSDNNTLTIPAEVAKELGLKPGESVELTPAEGGYLLARHQSTIEPPAPVTLTTSGEVPNWATPSPS